MGTNRSSNNSNDNNNNRRCDGVIEALAGEDVVPVAAA